MKKPSQSAKRSFHQREAVSTGYRTAAKDWEGGPSTVDSLLAPIESVDGLHQQKNIGFPIDKPAIPDMMRGISHNGFTTDHVLVGSRNVSCSQTAINSRVPLRHLWGTNGDQGDFGFSNWVYHLCAYSHNR